MLVQAAVAIVFGLALLYLRAAMGNPLFEFLAAVLAVVLAIGVLLFAAATEWMAAYIFEINHLHKGIFLLLAGGLTASACLFMVLPNVDSLHLLLLLATLHAFTLGCWSLFFARRVWRRTAHAAANISLGILSLAFAAAFYWTRPTDGRRAVALLGVYSCLIGIKLGYHALRILRTARRSGMETGLPLPLDSSRPIL